MIYVFRKPSEMISCRQSEAVTSRFVCGVDRAGRSLKNPGLIR